MLQSGQSAQSQFILNGRVMGDTFVAVACLGTAAFAWLVSWAPYGFDFSDEGLYLNWVQAPYLYKDSVTQFGFVYHWALNPLVGSVPALRIANATMTLACAWLACVATLISCRFEGTSFRSVALLALPLAFTAMLQIGDLSATPSYNSLNLQALLLTAAGISLIAASRKRSAQLGWVLLGFGGWLMFMAKPTTAVVAGLLSLVFLVTARKARFFPILAVVALCCLLLAASAIAIDGSLSAFIDRLAHSAALAGKMDNSYTLQGLFRSSALRLSQRDWIIVLITAGCISLAIVATQSGSLPALLGVTLGSAFFCLVPALSLAGILPVHSAGWQPTYRLYILAVPLAAGLAMIYEGFCGRLSFPALRPVALAAAFALLPFAYTFGSNGDYWNASAAAGLFWVLSAIVLMRSCVPQLHMLAVIPIAVSALAITVTVLSIGIDNPYRQTQSLRHQGSKVLLGSSGSEMMLADDFATYIREARRIAEAGGLEVGDPIIDLSGHYPGLLFALGAKAVGLPWIVGGYEGSEGLVRDALTNVTCEELVSSWLLREPNGPRGLPTAVLGEFETEYAIVGSLNSPRGAYPDSYTQLLLRPIHDLVQTTSACEAARATKS